MKVLVTGFEPFDRDSINPSLEAVRRLPPRLGDLIVATRVLPTAFGRALAALEDAVMTTAPDIVLLHSGRPATIAMLPEVAAKFRAAGYRFVTVGELLRLARASDINHPAKRPV